MMFDLRQFTIIMLYMMGISTGFAQNWFSNEIGVVFGPVVFQSDFGERRDLESTMGNTGFGIGFVHYMNFDYRTRGPMRYSYFNDHFRIRSEISWNWTNLKHFGQWAEGTSENAKKLKAHTGRANNLDVGMQLEYFPFSVKEFSYDIGAFAPYVSLGVHYTLFSPEVFTSYGDNDVNNLYNFFDPWRYPNGKEDTDFIVTEVGATFSIVGSIGTRYKLSRMSDLVLDLRWQRYFSDKVDGLNHKLPSNKANDHLIWLNFGYIFYLN